MGKGKIEKFAKLEKMPNVFHSKGWDSPLLGNVDNEAKSYKGIWHSEVFKNDNPIVLELACGYGEYTMNLAERFPDHNIIGIDLKGNRIFTGAKFTLEKGLNNAAFIRARINLIHHYFAPNEISEIWIPFADPHVRKAKHRKRLTSLRYLKIYQQILMPNGYIHLKTDSDTLYQYTLETIAESQSEIITNYPDLYNSNFDNELLAVKTRYEKLNPSGSHTIKYVKFKLGPTIEETD